jgi:O-antigen ligase
MLAALFYTLIIATPLVVFFSGMAMTPVLVLLALLVLLHVRPRKNILAGLRQSRYFLPLAVLTVMAGWGLLSAAWSITPERSVVTALRIFLMGVIGILACIHVRQMPPLSLRGLRFAAYGMGLVSLLMLFELLPSGGLMHRAYSFAGADYERFIEKNINRGLCALVVFFWPLALGLTRLGAKRLAVGLLLFLAAALLTSNSLSAQFGLMAGGVAFFLIRRWPVFSGRALIIALPLFLLSFTTLFAQLEKPFLGAREVEHILPQSSQHRIYIWHMTLIAAAERPLVGWGLDTARAVPLSQDKNAPEWKKVSPLHPHSPAVQIQLELGWVGLIIFTGGLFLLLRHWREYERDHMAWSGAMISSYFVAGLSSFGIWQNWWMATLFIALLLVRYLGGLAKAD